MALGYFDRDGATDRFSDHRGELVFAGWIADRARLRSDLRLPSEARDAQLAMEALERFGGDMQANVLGEWSLARLAPDGSLLLAVAATRRDRLFYAVKGRHAAAAPNLFDLAALDWVDDALDETGLLLSLGTAAVRRARAGRTMFQGIEEVVPGQSVTISADGAVTCRESVSPLAPQPAFEGGFVDAVNSANSLLVEILRDQIEGHRPAILLSGGLDSSLLASLIGDIADLLPMTSVTRPGGDAPDERLFAERVASALGARIHGFHIAEHDNIYRPGPHVFVGSNGGVLSNRLYLTDANQRLASSLGATCIVNGTYGEFSVTARAPTRSPNSLRAIAQRCRSALMPRETCRQSPCHVALSSHGRALLADAAEHSAGWGDTRGKGELFGYRSGFEKMLAHPNLYHPGAVRAVFPYRDVRLLRLFASFPQAYLQRADGDRVFARTILQDRLPDDIRMRSSGLPASPEHFTLLREHASVARNRLPAFRRAGVGELFDLEWLDRTLASVARRGPVDIKQANCVQLTAINAELLTWLRGG